ncbi:MAG: response regulator [Nitrospirae bacterium]|nr:response regulator [Nitrospirota bacterium]
MATFRNTETSKGDFTRKSAAADKGGSMGSKLEERRRPAPLRCGDGERNVREERHRPAPRCSGDGEKNQYEKRRRQSQKMEAIGRLAGGIAHDFNNLLTVILGHGQFVMRRLPSDDPVRLEVQQIVRSAERAAALTRQLLTFSRQQSVHAEVIDLNVIVENMSKLLRSLVGEDIAIEVGLGAGIGKIHADPSQVEQVLMNLAVNARDAMPMGGRISIETQNVEFDSAYVSQHPEAKPGLHVMLAVSDTGHGMDGETLSRVFEPFFTTKAKGEGTGLGLATVYGIAKQCGGHVSVYSEPDRGATFKVFFPRASAGGAPCGVEAKQKPAESATETILLVEDERMVRDLAARFLTATGYTVIEAADGIEAFRALESHNGPVHLLITDMVMPRMGGIEVVQRLREKLPEIRVLYMSGYTERRMASNGNRTPGADFIQKPFTLDGLALKVREALDARTRANGAGSAEKTRERDGMAC